MGQKAENTNMTSEFYIMSILYRIGLEPVLTLGNKKDIDIVLRENNTTYTIDVKGLKGKTNWPIGNSEKIKSLKNLKDHFFILVTYLNRFNDILIPPEIFVVPARDADTLKVHWGKQDQYSIEYRDIKNSKYQNAWHYFIDKTT